ncbi:MAG: putative Zn-dependent peptidase [Planctomycetota bacterium]|jgi:predicted Zn-dependent peptidase
MPSSTNVTIMALTGVGALYEEKDEAGISHMLEHMMFKGTETLTSKELIFALDGLGAETNAFTSYEYTGYYAKTAVQKWKKVFHLVSDIYLSVVFPEQELGKEKGVVQGEIDMYEDDPTAKISSVFRALAYKGYVAEQLISGTKDNVSGFTKDQLERYYQQHYQPKNTVVVVAGDVSTKDVLVLARERFQGMEGSGLSAPRATKVIQSAPLVQVCKRKTDQAHIMMGVHTFARGHKDENILRVLTYILGGNMSSRLFIRLREEMGMGYYVSSYQQSFHDHGMLVVRTGTEPRRVAEVIEAIQEECLRIAGEGVSERELRQSKDSLCGTTQLHMETSDAWAQWFGIHELLGHPTTLSARLRAIRSVTAKDIQRVAKKIFKSERLVCAVLTPKAVDLEKIVRF